MAFRRRQRGSCFQPIDPESLDKLKPPEEEVPTCELGTEGCPAPPELENQSCHEWQFEARIQDPSVLLQQQYACNQVYRDQLKRIMAELDDFERRIALDESRLGTPSHPVELNRERIGYINNLRGAFLESAYSASVGEQEPRAEDEYSDEVKRLARKNRLMK